MIRVEQRDHVAIVTLEREVTNAINLELAERLDEVLTAIRDDPGVRAIVLASGNDKFFSIGFSIPELYDLPQEAFLHFYHAVNRAFMNLYTLPKPTVAALMGHAIAGGCIMALCCDYRVIAEGRKLMGLNEIKLGVPVPYIADCILRDLVGTRYAREIMDFGEFYESDALLAVGMVDQVQPLEAVFDAAVDKARVLGTAPAEAFALIKRNRVGPIEAQVLAHLEGSSRSFVERWYSEEARWRLREAMARF